MSRTLWARGTLKKRYILFIWDNFLYRLLKHLAAMQRITDKLMRSTTSTASICMTRAARSRKCTFSSTRSYRCSAKSCSSILLASGGGGGIHTHLERSGDGEVAVTVGRSNGWKSTKQGWAANCGCHYFHFLSSRPFSCFGEYATAI